MARNYISNEQKIKDFIEIKLIPILNNNDLDINKILPNMAMELDVKKELILKILQNYAEVNKIGWYLTIPSEKMIDWLKEQKEIDNEVEDIKKLNIGGKK